MDTQHILDKATSILQEAEIIQRPSPFSNLFKRKKVTVVITSYNSEAYVKKCLDSVINQTFSFKKIELIIVDDYSTDGTRNILLQYANEHPNITLVFLAENSGTAAMPRNVGIELATTERIMFLDADDWLAENAIQALVDVMDEGNDDFVVGKTVKVTDSGESVHAEFVSYKERRHCSPFDIPYLFYHMGPPAKIMKTSIIKENNIRFHEMRFGEDKLFLFQVLINCSKISTITEVIYYVNRLSSNSSSLTRTTDVLDKRAADMKIFQEVLAMNLPIEKEIVLIKRLVEYDFVKTCDSFVFVRSDAKQEFIDFIKKALTKLASRPYNIIEYFDSPLYKTGAVLVQEEKYDEFITLFTWYKNEKNKHIVIKDGIAYYDVSPFDKNHKFKLIPIPLFVRFKDSYTEGNEYVQIVEVFGTKINTIKDVIVRDRKRLNNEIRVPISIHNHIGEIRIKYEDINKLESSLFTLFIRYDEFRLANIKEHLESRITYEGREFIFYITKAGNVGLSIKE